MATVTGFTAARMQAIEDATLIDANIVAGNLIFTRHDESTFNAGSVAGPPGPDGPSGINVIANAAARPGSPYNGQVVYQIDVKRFFVWDGSAWVWTSGNPMRCKVGISAAQSVNDSDVDDIIWNIQEYDTDNIWTPGGSGNLLTIPAGGAGLWRFNLNATFGISATGIRQFSIYHNFVGQCAVTIPGNAALPVGSSLSIDLVCADADTIKASVYQTSGAPLSLNPYTQVNMSAIRIA